ncbi:MAG: cyclic lactone autoinducer peptide [Bacillota bacterium]
MKRRLLLLLSFVLLLLAHANITFACSLWWYQPDLPKSLK